MRGYLIFAILLYSCAEPRFQDQSASSISQGISPNRNPVTANADEPQSSDVASGDPQAGVTSPIGPVTSVPVTAPTEGVTAPVQINGTFLVCAKLLDTSADESISKTTVACRLEATDGTHLKSETVNAEATYSVKTTEIKGLSVNVLSLNDENRIYDTIIEYSVSNHGDSQAAADSAIVSLEFRDIATGLAIGSWSKVTKGVYQPLNAGYWIRNGTTQHTFIDTVTTLTWGIDDQQVYSMQDALSHCAESTYDNRTGWRLPTVDELKIATADGLGSVYSGPEDMNTISNAIDYYWSATLGMNTQGYSVNIKQADHRVLQSSQGSLLGVICVIDPE